MLENPFKPNTPIEKTNPEANRKLVETLLGSQAAEQYAKLDEGRVGKKVDDYADMALTDEERNILTEAHESIWNREKYISWAKSLGGDEQWVVNTFIFNDDGTVECGNLYLSYHTELKEFPPDLTIKGFLDLYSLNSANNLTLPTSIGGYLDLRSLISADGLILPTSIDGYLDLQSLTSADGLILPTSIDGYLDLQSLTSADGLALPTFIGGSLYLDSLTSADGLVIPDDFEVTGDVYIKESLTPLFERLKAEGKIKGKISVV